MGFCNNITPSCESCYEATYGECNDVITLSLGLTPLTTYYLDLIDKFDIVTPLTVVTDGSGDFDITQTWSEFFGAVEIQIFTDPARVHKVTFTVDTTAYNCIVAVAGGITSTPITCPLTLDFSFTCNSQYINIP